MYHEPKPRRGLRLAGILCVPVLLAVVGLAVLNGKISSDMTAQGAAALEQSVRRAAVQCYAIEGAYPPSLQYLVDNYGVQVNTSRYYVSYSVFASNRMPDIAVQVKP